MIIESKFNIVRFQLYSIYDDKMEEFQEFMNDIQDAYILETLFLAKKLGVSDSCAMNIQYLRTRSRWTQDLEEELIRMDKEEGRQPNMCDWP